jgi:proteasome accessory factor A
MLVAVAEELMRREPGLAEVLLFKTNVDHSGSGATWGCHTSFMHRGNPEKFPAQIIPHLVSRIVYSGAGGLELTADGRLRFTLSPRVRFLECEVSNNSTSERGIFHTKDETLAEEGYHRLHIITGESLCSETALWLNMGATALIRRNTCSSIFPTPSSRKKDGNPCRPAFLTRPRLCRITCAGC